MKKRILSLGLSFLLVTALVLTSCGEAVPGEQEEEEEEEEEITPTLAEEEVNFRLWISSGLVMRPMISMISTSSG